MEALRDCKRPRNPTTVNSSGSGICSNPGLSSTPPLPGIKTEVFLFYPPKDDSYKTVFTDDGREFWFKLDGKNIYENPQGPNGLGQTVGMWLIDRNTLYRERMTKGVIDERVLYRVSPDGKTLVWTNFNSAGDSGHTVWDRIELPPR